MSDKSDTPMVDRYVCEATAYGCRSLDADGVTNGKWGHNTAALIIALRDELDKAEAENAALKSRLESDPRHSYDGIDCRDETIKLQDEEIEKLKAENAALRESVDIACDRAYCEGMTAGRNMADDDERFYAAYNARRRDINTAIDAARRGE